MQKAYEREAVSPKGDRPQNRGEPELGTTLAADRPEAMQLPLLPAETVAAMQETAALDEYLRGITYHPTPAIAIATSVRMHGCSPTALLCWLLAMTHTAHDRRLNLTNPQIGKALGVSEHTIRKHLNALVRTGEINRHSKGPFQVLSVGPLVAFYDDDCRHKREARRPSNGRLGDHTGSDRRPSNGRHKRRDVETPADRSAHPQAAEPSAGDGEPLPVSESLAHVAAARAEL